MRLLIKHAVTKTPILVQAQAIICLNEKRKNQVYVRSSF